MHTAIFQSAYIYKQIFCFANIQGRSYACVDTMRSECSSPTWVLGL